MEAAHFTIPSGAQAYLQTAGSYLWLAGANYEAGKAFTLTSKYTVGSNPKDTRIRVQSNDVGKAVPFYIGDIAITEDAASASTGGSGKTAASASSASKFTNVTFEDHKSGGFAGIFLYLTKPRNCLFGNAVQLLYRADDPEQYVIDGSRNSVPASKFDHCT